MVPVRGNAERAADEQRRSQDREYHEGTPVHPDCGRQATGRGAWIRASRRRAGQVRGQRGQVAERPRRERRPVRSSSSSVVSRPGW